MMAGQEPTISYSNHVFTCGKRKLRVCRSIYDFTSSFEKKDKSNKLQEESDQQTQQSSKCNQPDEIFSWSLCAQKELFSVTSEDKKQVHHISCQGKGSHCKNGCQGCSLLCCKSKSPRPCLRLQTNFILERSDGKEKITILKIEDSFEDLIVEQDNTFEFNRKILTGFLFKENGLYFQFGDLAKVDKSNESCFYPNWNSIALKQGSFHFDFFFQQVENGFYVDGSISSQTMKEFSSTLAYKVEILPFKSEALPSSTLKQTSREVKRRSGDSIDEELRNNEEEQEDINSTTSTNYFDKGQIKNKLSQATQKPLLKKRQYEEQSHFSQNQDDYFNEDEADEDEDSWTSNQQKNNNIKSTSKCTQELDDNFPAQPKKNVVKNFVKAFRKYVNKWGDEQVLLECLNARNYSDIKEFRATYKKFEASHKFNNAFIKALILEEPFKNVFSHFVRIEAWDWLDKSQVCNKKSHKDVLTDYLAAVKDPSQIENIHSLRTRNRPTPKRIKAD